VIRGADILAALGDEGFLPVEVPYLLDMEDFVRVSGEEFRRRLFVTTDPDGRQYCLRPEFTLPVCRMKAASGGRFSYAGTIFRKGRPGTRDEVAQAGAEIIGPHDAAETDAEILALALAITARAGVHAPRVLVGDVGLFAGLLAALEVPPAWTRRLMHAFGDTPRVLATLADMSRPRENASAFARHGDIVAALAAFQGEAVGDLFAEILAIAGIETVGGRSTDEIAERVLEQASLAAHGIISEDRAAIIRDFLDADGQRARGHLDATYRLDEAEALFTGLSARLAALGLPASSASPFAAAREAFGGRLAGIRAKGIDTADIQFSPGFGRRLGYYDGFVFDVTDPARPGIGQVAGGGRYDGVVRAFGAPDGFRAAGFAVWPERLYGVAP